MAACSRIGLSLCARTGNIYAGLYYPMIVAGITLVSGTIFLKETHGTLIWAEYDAAFERSFGQRLRRVFGAAQLTDASPK